MEVTQEILDELRPKLCPYNTGDITCTIEYLELFLPVVVPVEKVHVGYGLWFEELMALWEVCHNASSWENVRNCLFWSVCDNSWSLATDMADGRPSKLQHGLYRLGPLHSNHVHTA